MPPKTYKKKTYRKKSTTSAKSRYSGRKSNSNLVRLIKQVSLQQSETKMATYDSTVLTMYHNISQRVRANMLQTGQGITDGLTINNRIGDTVSPRGVKLYMTFRQPADRPNVTFKVWILKIHGDVTPPTFVPLKAITGNNMMDPVDTEKCSVVKVLQYKFGDNYWSSTLGNSKEMTFFRKVWIPLASTPYVYGQDNGGLGKKFDIPHRYTTYPSKCFQHTSNQLFHGYGWFFEGVFNRNIVDLLEPMLKNEGFNTLKLYNEIDDTPLKLRSGKANGFKDYDAAILVSVHGNAGPTGANGWEVFTSPGQTQADTLATLIYDEVKNTNLFRMRPDITEGDVDKEAKFHMVCNVKVPAVLTENGFFTDRNDAMKMFSTEGQQKIAKAHFEGIKKYFSILSF